MFALINPKVQCMIIIKLKGMTSHSSKYYHLIKTLRIQKKNQSELLRQVHQRRLNRTDPSSAYTLQQIEQQINKDSIVQCNQKDRKITVKLSHLQDQEEEFPRLWVKFESMSLTRQAKEESDAIQKASLQKKDEKLIDEMFEEASSLKRRKQEQINTLSLTIKKKQSQITLMKQKGIELSLQIQAFTRQLTLLKQAFDKQQKVINERSAKFKEERSKDLMIKNINRQDMQMRRAMQSKIKLNQQLDLGFQIQRRKAFNSAKQTINNNAKAVQNQLTQVNNSLKEQQRLQNQLIDQRNVVERQKAVISGEIVYFAKSLLKHFSNHSRGVEWLINILHQACIEVRQQDLPNELKKEDAEFLSSLISKARNKFQPSKYYVSASNFTPRTKGKQKTNYHFNTEPKEPQDPFHLDHLDRIVMHNHSKTTVHFDIQNNSILNSSNEKEPPLFKINSQSLKKVYESTGDIISKMIRNKQWNHDSCKNIPNTARQTEPELVLDKNMIEDKIRERFVNVRQKDRRNFMRKLLFGHR